MLTELARGYALFGDTRPAARARHRGGGAAGAARRRCAEPPRLAARAGAALRPARRRCCWRRAGSSRRSPATAPAAPSRSGWPPPMPTTTTASATWRSAPSRSATPISPRAHFDDALASYHVGLAISERLAAADRTNIRAQHGVLVAQLKIGDVLRLQGELDARARELSRKPRLRRAAGRRRSRQSRMAARAAASPIASSPTCWRRRARPTRRWRITAPATPSPSARPPPTRATRAGAASSGSAHERIGALLEARGEFDRGARRVSLEPRDRRPARRRRSGR